MGNVGIFQFNLVIGLLLAWLLVGCGGNGGGNNESGSPSKPGATELFLEGYDAPAGLIEGQSKQIQPVLVFEDGSSEALSGDSVAWTSSDTTVVSISGQGLLTAVSTGTVTITATTGGVTATLDVSVVARELVELRFDPESVSFALGTSLNINLFGTYNDDTREQVDATSGIELTSSDPAVFVLDDGRFGRLQSRGVGAALLTARSVSGVEVSANVEVGAATLTSILLSPDAVSRPAGIPIAVSALGTFSDGTQRDVSSDVSWDVGGLPGASISATGTVSANSPGEATVSAAFEGVAGTLLVNFTEAALQDIEVLSGDGVVPLGRTLQLQVRGSFSDGSTALISDAIWAVEDGSILTVSEEGRVTTLALGETLVTATVNGFASGSVVRVTAAVLEAIEVAVSGLPNGTLPVGFDATASATGLYSDSSREDLSNEVVWSFDPGSVASVSASGVITAIAPGVGQVSATYLGRIATAEVEVTPAVLESVRITADSLVGVQLSKAKGLSEPISLLGQFSDGSEATVPFVDATWVVGDPSVVSVGTDGHLWFLSVGTTTLEARFSGFSDVITVITSEAIPLSLEITSYPTELYVASQEPLSAELVFSDGSRNDVTDVANWVSSDPSIARVLVGGGHPVRIEGLSTGVVDISATTGLAGSTFSDSATVSVLPSILVVECLQSGFFGSEWRRCASSEGGTSISTSATFNQLPRPAWFTVAEFRFTAEGRDWEIAQVTATNNNTAVDVRVMGIGTGAVIPKGETVPVVVEVQPTSGATVTNNITIDVIGNDGLAFRVITATYQVTTN